MADAANLTYLAGLAIATGLVIYGGLQILRQREKNEVADDVVPRQLRGFFFLILGSVILSLSTSMAQGRFNLADLIYSTRP